ncbi:MAG TPA: sulfotransferase domain-containing protein [Pseudolabrys sp.]|jgi:hypothetical protein|nr:sulfotransferase domain-containing protein [Pseudolabrys sp.]
MKTVWLASYPKSGNTWFRFLVANLGADEPIDINDLAHRNTIASGRAIFDYFLAFDSSLLTHDELDLLRPAVHAAAAADPGPADIEADGVPGMSLIKTHDAYTANAAGEPILGGARGADGAIVLVRDPRDVAPSLANHNRSTIDEAIASMANPNAAYCFAQGREYPQVRQLLSTWSRHVASWLDQRDIPVHLIRYEDLLASPAEVFAAAMAFCGHEAPAEAIGRAVRFSHFDRLQSQEREKGFREWLDEDAGGRLFFRQGKAGAWTGELSEAQVARIESEHRAVMTRLGYGPVTPGRLAAPRPAAAPRRRRR